MKNVKKILAFVLATIMALSCLAGMMPVFAAEDDAAEVPTPTYELDFSKYHENLHDSFYIHNGAGALGAIEGGDNGYMTVNITGDWTPIHFQMGHGTFQKGSDLVVDVPANQMGYFVIKYKTKQTNVASLYVSTTNTSETDPATGAFKSGSIGYDRYPLWNWNGLDEWTVQVVDASNVWGSVADNEYINHFLLRPAMDGEHTSANPVHISYIKFFATAEDAEAFADSEATKKVEVEAGRAELTEGYSIGGKKFLTTSESEPFVLTPTELDVCRLVVQGLTLKEISITLGKSVSNVSTVRGNIRKKLGLEQDDDLKKTLLEK